MKSFLPPILLLAALLCFSLLNCAAIVRDTDRWSAQLEQADTLAKSEDWASAEAALADSYADWNACQTFLHIVMKHEEVDGAESMYRQAFAFAETEELSEFRAEVAELRNQFRLLAEMERISIKNVL